MEFWSTIVGLVRRPRVIIPALLAAGVLVRWPIWAQVRRTCRAPRWC